MTFEKTLAIWLPIVSRITVTRIDTSTSTPRNMATVIRTAVPAPALPAAAGGGAVCAGTHV